jgi:hypothetical protein
MNSAFTKLAANIAARNAGKFLGLTGLGAGAAAGISHGLDAASMGLDDAISFGKSYYSPLVKAVGYDDIAKLNDQAAEAANTRIIDAIKKSTGAEHVFDLSSPALRRPEHLMYTGLGGALGALRFTPVSAKKKPSLINRLLK